jgi:hypothetical protein
MKIDKIKVDYTTPLKQQLEELRFMTYMDLSDIKNSPESMRVNDGYIYDVEDGEEMMGKSVQDCKTIFKTQNRRALNVYEALALYRYNKEVLNHHYIDIGGSRYIYDDNVPNLYLGVSRPKLDWDYVDYSNGRYGSASCGSLGSSASRDLDFGKNNNLINKKTMIQQLTSALKRALSPDLQALYKAGLINGGLEATQEGTNELLDILRVVHQDKLVERANEIIADEEKKK